MSKACFWVWLVHPPFWTKALAHAPLKQVLEKNTFWCLTASSCVKCWVCHTRRSHCLNFFKWSGNFSVKLRTSLWNISNHYFVFSFCRKDGMCLQFWLRQRMDWKLGWNLWTLQLSNTSPVKQPSRCPVWDTQYVLVSVVVYEWVSVYKWAWHEWFLVVYVMNDQLGDTNMN